MKKTQYNKPKVAIIYPSQDDKKKMTLMIPGVNIKEVCVFSHEKLSELRKWAYAHGYTVDESRLKAKPKKQYQDSLDEEDYYY